MMKTNSIDISGMDLDSAYAASPLGETMDCPLYVNGQVVDTHKAIVRVNTGETVGIVGANYRDVQDSELFERMRPFVEGGHVELLRAGTFRSGAGSFILSKIKGSDRQIVPGDSIEKYLLTANTHNGSMNSLITDINHRPACANQFPGIYRAADNWGKVRHTRNANERLNYAYAMLRQMVESFDATAEQLRFLANHTCNERSFVDYTRKLFAPTGTTEITKETAQRTVDKVIPLYENGAGQNIAGVRGTWYGAYNAITEYLTHYRGRSADARKDSLWFGPSAQVATKALELAVQLAA